MSLPPDEVHIWTLGADDAAEPYVPVERLLALLSDEERGRHARFVFARDRDRFLLAHAALRLILARYGSTPPASLVFERNRYGRPEIVRPPSLEGLRFNLSHTHGLIAVAVCASRDVGVDAEWHARQMTDLQALANRFFSAVEARALRAEPADSRLRRFFEYWTLKESYIKARGMGLALPLDGFWFHLDEDASPRIEIDPALGDEPSEWRFLLTRPTADHTLAAAVRAKDDDVGFVVRRVSLAALADAGSGV